MCYEQDGYKIFLNHWIHLFGITCVNGYTYVKDYISVNDYTCQWLHMYKWLHMSRITHGNDYTCQGLHMSIIAHHWLHMTMITHVSRITHVIDYTCVNDYTCVKLICLNLIIVVLIIYFWRTLTLVWIISMSKWNGYCDIHNRSLLRTTFWQNQTFAVIQLSWWIKILCVLGLKSVVILTCFNWG